IGAVNNGAFYYIQKPFKNEELVAIVRRAAEHRNLRRESKAQKTESRKRDRSGRPIGASKTWLDALHVAESVAGTDSTVLLQDEIKRGNFRSDLFYRLNVISIVLPPLRDRPGDIPLLSEAFLKRAAESRAETAKTLAPEAVEVMQHYSWPGNVRELENALERAVILAKGDIIPLSALPERIVEPR